ncbi:MAG: hypothetical protein JWQ79_4220 [Mucilaginibacter sp.]|nr:hypothetical protein [Mucilaginibacter sp.]
MGKLRHIVLSVDDVHKTADFYRSVFDLEITESEDHRVWLSDGVVSLAIIDANKHANASGGPRGLNHFGFAVEDIDGTVDQVLTQGGFHHDTVSGKDRGAARQVKLKDPNGVYLEVVNTEHARKKWHLPG